MSENQQSHHEDQTESAKKPFIIIPSYEEVFNSSQPCASTSLFRPSSSFSDTFSFIKSTEFYAPPTAPRSANSATSSNTGQSIAVTTSVSTPSVASTSSLPPSPQISTQSRNAILVSHRQKGNPLLKHIRNVKWMFADVVCDYLLGQNSCALYLSIRYHLLHPDYLYYRIRELQKTFRLRIVLCHVDVEDVVKPLLEITKTALLHDCTLLCGWSLEECGRYLETIKIYENKSADSIRERMDTDYMSRLNHALTAIRHVNKNDVVTLGSMFGSLSCIMDASMEELARCPGIGDRKVKRLYDTFHEPFKRAMATNLNPLPESSITKAHVEGETKEGVEEKPCDNREAKKPCLSVRSALAAAFTKYTEKCCSSGSMKHIADSEIPKTPDEKQV